MPDITLISWRDIPAQVMVGSGRKAVKRELPERFQVAIDMAAMRGGARDTDAYLADWRRTVIGTDDGDPEVVVANTAARIEADYDAERLRNLVENEGREP